jgi:hypothetical protein
MRKIDALLSEYGESHQNPTNKFIHWICVPLIFLSIVGLLASIPSGTVQSFLGEGNPYAKGFLSLAEKPLVNYDSAPSSTEILFLIDRTDKDVESPADILFPDLCAVPAVRARRGDVVSA